MEVIWIGGSSAEDFGYENDKENAAESRLWFVFYTNGIDFSAFPNDQVLSCMFQLYEVVPQEE